MPCAHTHHTLITKRVCGILTFVRIMISTEVPIWIFTLQQKAALIKILCRTRRSDRRTNYFILVSNILRPNNNILKNDISFGDMILKSAKHGICWWGFYEYCCLYRLIFVLNCWYWLVVIKDVNLIEHIEGKIILVNNKAL